MEDKIKAMKELVTEMEQIEYDMFGYQSDKEELFELIKSL